MGLSTVFLCGRGPGARAGSHRMAECDRPSCDEQLLITGAAEYAAAAHAGWRREPSTGQVRCPAHAADLARPPEDRHDPGCATLTGDCTCAEIAGDVRRRLAAAAAKAAGIR